MKYLGRNLVRFVDWIKKTTGLHTYQVELLTVAIVLASVLCIKRGEPVEIVGAIAVFFSFAHAKVANRLAEREAYRSRMNICDGISVSYHHKVKYYFYMKESLWFVYFIALGAWSALVGTFIFLLYEPWRKLWRQYHPLEDKLQV